MLLMNGKAVLHSTVLLFCGKAGAIGPLIEAGADIEQKKSDGLMPLGCATKCSYCEIMCALLQHEANTDVQLDQGDTLLHLACHEQYDEGLEDGLNAAVDILLGSGADETAVNDDVKTPLELLDLPSPFEGLGGCPPEKMERARLLLTRAPADRTWRRRCLLLMLYSRAKEVLWIM